MLVIAHRGASADAPENSAAAFELAIEQGADMIETDLHLLRDGAIGLIHDSRVGGLAIGGLTLEELRQRRPATPTLSETLDAFARRVPWNLELKRGETDYSGLEQRALDLVRDHAVLEQTVFSSFFDSVLRRIRELEPLARIGLLASARSARRVERRADSLRAEAVHLHASLVSPERIQALHARGLMVRVYTVDDPAMQQRLIDLSIDGIFTNEPGSLRALLFSRAQ